MQISGRNCVAAMGLNPSLNESCHMHRTQYTIKGETETGGERRHDQ